MRCLISVAVFFCVAVAQVSCETNSISVSCGIGGERQIQSKTLEDCLSNLTLCFRNNCVVQFGSGVYHVPPQSPSKIYLVENMTNLTLKGTNRNTAINCSRRASIGFINVTRLAISDITFLSCGVEISNTVLQKVNATVVLPLKLRAEQKIGIFLLNVTHLVLDQIVVEKSLGYGIFGINVLGISYIENSQIIQSNFHNNYSDHLDCSKYENISKCSGGNALFLYTNSAGALNHTNETRLTISNTNISEGRNFVNNVPKSLAYNPSSTQSLISGGGLSLLLLQQHYNVSFVYNSSFCISNKGLVGANIYINVFNFVMNSSILIDQVTLSLGNEHFKGTVDHFPTNAADYASGGGLYYEYGNYLEIDKKQNMSDFNLCYNISFQNVKFISNFALRGGGAFVKLHLSPTNQFHIKHHLQFDNCTFQGNVAFYGASLHINELQYKQIFNHAPSIDNVFTCSIKDTVFEKHILGSQIELRADAGISSAVFLNGIHGDLTLTNVAIRNNKGCAGMLLINSAVMCDSVTINNNQNNANGGGAILTGESYFILYPNSNLTIANNSADHHGGGIFIPSLQPYSYQPLCFFQVLSKSQVPASLSIKNISEYNAFITFMNNTAKEGYDIYGGDLEKCFLLFWDIKTAEAYHFFIKTEKNNRPSKVTSYAQTLCFCSGELANCNNRSQYIEAYPGQNIIINAVPVGQLNGTTSTSSITTANFPGKNDFFVFSSDDQKLKKTCGNLTYQFGTTNDPQIISNSMKKERIFYLLIEGTLEKYYWKTITIKVMPCPPFFHYNNSLYSRICECASLTKQFNIKCSRSEAAVIVRPPDIYVGYHNNCTYIYRYCPIDRCSEEEVKMSSQEQDKQCVNNRQGVMCGKCKDGYSRIIGSNKCQKCNNINLLLILVFAVEGILLVWGLSFFNLTVSTGMINGIIFYANIVKVNRDIFYPVLSNSNGLTLLIAWLNLDFGIECCLFDGMNEFHKTLLQLSFPVYLWFLSLLAIYLSRHYRMVGKILGKHSTPALATILLLSFTKLLNIIARIFSPIKIHQQCGDNKVDLVLAWWSDATIPFFGIQHIVLMVLATVLIMFGILPYTLLLSTSPLLQRFNHFKVFRWVARLKPFLDAYEGPYNESSQYWTGFLLLVRLGMMSAFAFNIYGYKVFQCFIIAVVSIALLILTVNGKGVYRSKFLSYFEAVSILNLAIYSVTIQYLIVLGERKGLKADIYVSWASLSICAVQFLMVVLYQAVITVLSKCGIVEENNFKEWTMTLLSLKKHAARFDSISGSSRLKYMINYKTFEKENGATFNESSDSSTDEDLWNKSVHDFREPLLNHLMK